MLESGVSRNHTNSAPSKNQFPEAEESRRWANRILIVSIIGIIFLTLFPFRLDPYARPLPQRSPFLPGDSLKMVGRLDFTLNVLLFVPFGAGLAAIMRKRGAGRGAGLLVAMAAGALTSYLVELLQLYIPMRDSGWNDVVSNSLVRFYDLSCLNCAGSCV